METARESGDSVRPPTAHRSGWLWKLFHWVLFYWTAAKVEASDREGVVHVYDVSKHNRTMAKEIGKSVYWLWKLFDWTAEKVDVSDGEHGAVHDDVTSPVELAKDYIGSNPSKVSPIMALTENAPPVQDNCFITPRSRKRLAIYNIAPNPRSKLHRTSNLKVIEDDNASLAELAYMGSRPSKGSPSVIGMHNRVDKEDTRMLSSLSSASSSPIVALIKKYPSAPDKGFITPRSRSRSTIYNMARTPNSKLHRTSNIKDDNASPDELAYMGSRPSKGSPSVIGMHNRVDKEDTRMLSSLSFASSSPIVALIKKYPSAPDKGFIAPRSRGKLAINNMTLTSYSKLHRTSNLKVNEDNNAYPAKHAKAYMENRPSKFSPSVLEMRNRVGREDTRFLSSMPSASSSPIMALRKKAPVASDNGFITPRSRGTSTIYNMACTPYSKLHRTSNLEVNENDNVYPAELARAYMGSRPSKVIEEDNVSPAELAKAYMGTKPSKVIEDDNASPAELAKAYMGSRPSKVSPLVIRMCNRVSREDTRLLTSFPSASSSPRIPLPKMAPTAPDNGFITPRSRGRSTIYNMARVLRTQLLLASNPKRAGIDSNGSAGPSMPSSLSLVESNDKFGSPKTYVAPLGKNDSVESLKASTSESNEKFSSPKTYVAPRDKNDYVESLKASTSESNEKIVSPKTYLAPLDKNDSVVSLKASNSSVGAADIIEKAEAGTSASQPPQNKGAFRKSVQEDFFEQEDITHCNELAPITRKISEVNSNAVTHGEETRSASQLPVFPAAFDEPKEANNPPVFSFTPAAVGNIPSLPSESTKEAELKTENSRSVFNVSTSSGSGKFGSSLSVASNGQPSISIPPPPTSSNEKFGSPKTYVAPLDKNDSVVSLKASTSGADDTDFIEKDGASTSQPPQNKEAFRMSVQEDFFEYDDDDADYNELPPRPFSETKGTMEVSLKGSNVAPKQLSEMKRKYPEQIPECTNRKRCRIC